MLHRTLFVLTLALVSGVLGFGAVVAVLHLGGREASMALSLPLQAGLALAGVALLATAQRMGSALSRPAPGAPAEATVERIRTGVIVAMALRESVGLMGAVLGLVSGELLLMSALIAASVATMILGIPGRDELEHTLRRAEG
jgi:hypothetical protein